MKEELPRRTFLTALSLLGLSALAAPRSTGAAPSLDLSVWLNAHPAVRDAIAWENVSSGSAKLVPYLRWSQAQKAELTEAFDRATSGKSIALADPAPNVIQVADYDFVYTALKPDDAWKLYLSHIANSLALEAGNRLPWSMAGDSTDDLGIIFNSREMFAWNPRFQGYEIEPLRSGWAVPALPDRMLSFLSTNHIVSGARATMALSLPSGLNYNHRLATIANLLNWCRNNLYHYMGQPGGKNMQDQWQYRGYPPVSRVIAATPYTGYPAQGISHRTAGCHGTVGLLRAVLRTVNIPVKPLAVANHALAFFPTESRYLSHGDDPYTAEARTYPPKTSPPFPAAKLLIDEAKFNAWFGSSVPEATKEKNIGRRPRELAIETPSVYVLRKHCGDLAANRSHALSDVYQIFKPNYTVAQLEAANLWSRMDAEIAKLGGCGAIPQT